MKPIIKAYSDKGNRKENQDVTFSKIIDSSSSLCILADGMGGYYNGAEAAKIVIDAIYTYILQYINILSPEELLQRSIEKANCDIESYIKANNMKIGATVSVILCKESTAYIAWLGDVRIYKIRQNIIEKLTEDHVLPDYPHIVTKCVKGKIFEVDTPCTYTDILCKDMFIICSDGFYNCIDDKQLVDNILYRIFTDISSEDNRSAISICF